MNRVFKKRVVFMVAAASFVALLYFLSFMSESQVEEITNSLGWLGPVFIGFFILITQVFAPLSGTPGILVGIRLYGYANTMALFYFTSMLSAGINFWLARTYGKRIVAKLTGSNSLKEIDSLARTEERTLLIVSRIFGFYLFDIISYAVGLTAIRFKKYIVYTALFSLIPFGVQYLIFRNLNFKTVSGILIYYGSIAMTGAVFAKYFYKYAAKNKRKEPSNTVPNPVQSTFVVSRPDGGD